MSSNKMIIQIENQLKVYRKEQKRKQQSRKRKLKYKFTETVL